jgi:hypothetical protein
MTERNSKVLASLTNDEQMGRPARFSHYTKEELLTHLKASPRNAVVLQVISLEGEDMDLQEVAVWCGASDEANNYYTQVLPLDEPDADGGNLTAEEALADAGLK